MSELSGKNCCIDKKNYLYNEKNDRAGERD